MSMEFQVRDNVWALGVKHSGYDMIYKFCCCSCGHGHLRGGQEQPVEEDTPFYPRQGQGEY